MSFFSDLAGIFLAAVLLIFAFPVAVKLFFALGPIGFCILAIGILVVGFILERR